MLGFFKRRSNAGGGDSDGSSVATLDKITIPLNDASKALSAVPQRVSPYRRPELHTDDSVVPTEAYTNGFESIYAMENVDLKTVRPMGQGDRSDQARTVVGSEQKDLSRSQPEPEAPVLKLVKNAPATKSLASSSTPLAPLVPEFLGDQLELDLGPEFRSWVEPFRLSEPIQVLGLSNIAQKALLDHRKTHLRDLLDIDRKGSVGMKGLGQGHIDEVLEKLGAYLKDSPKERSGSVDFAALVRTIVGAGEKKAAYLAMCKYGMEDLISLNPTEQAELRHLNADQERDLTEELTYDMESERHARRVRRQIDEVLQVFVKSWMRTRNDVALMTEVDERLEKKGLDPKRARAALTFFTELYYEGKSPYSRSLFEVEPGVFVPDRWAQARYKKVLATAKTYFYRYDVTYPLRTLVSYIERECAREWIGFPEGFVAKVLRASPQLSVRKGKNGLLSVKRV